MKPERGRLVRKIQKRKNGIAVAISHIVNTSLVSSFLIVCTILYPVR